MTPTIYLTTAGAVTAVRTGKARPETRAAVGPGPVYTIMRNPRPSYGEAGTGRVLSLTPRKELLAEAQDALKAAGDHEREQVAWNRYEAGLIALWRPALLPPSRLTWCRGARPGEAGAARWDGEMWMAQGEVQDDATLICACGMEKAKKGRCHRVVAARLLAQYGWRVVLDGEEIGG